jgi:hypothetical protein
MLFKDADKGGVHPRQHGNLFKALGDILHPCSAGEGKHHIIACNGTRRFLNELIFALPFYGKLFKLNIFSILLKSQAQGGSKGGNLILPSGKAGLNAGTATQNKDLFERCHQLFDFSYGFLFTNYHRYTPL